MTNTTEQQIDYEAYLVPHPETRVDRVPDEPTLEDGVWYDYPERRQ